MEEAIPEIKRCSLSNTILYLKVLGISDVISFEYFEAPDTDQIIEALVHLYLLGALDCNGQVTERGRIMSQFPLEPCLSRMVVDACKRGCSEDLATIVGMLSSENIWVSRRRKDGSRDEEAEEMHKLFHHAKGDHISYLKLYKAWELNNFSDQWCRKYFVSFRALRTAKNIKAQIESEIQKANLTLRSAGKDINSICKSICSGLLMNGAQKCMNNTMYRTIPFHDDPEVKLVHIHPNSALASNTDVPDFIVYQDLVYTAKAFVRHVVAVKYSWLEKLREPLQPPDVNSLCGRKPKQNNEKSNDGESALQDKAKKEIGKTPAQQSKRADSSKLAAAKLRYLARKS